MPPFETYPVTLRPHPRRANVLVACEYELPAGSFKTRGAAAVVAGALEAGAPRVSLDSSGNAGLAVALAARRAGLSATVRVASSIRPDKLALLTEAGAVVDLFVTRAEAVAACEADASAYDASHVRNPLFREGVATFWDAWPEEIALPDEILMPVGNGTLLLGLWLGLSRRGLAVPPRLVGVQAADCAPIATPDRPGAGRTIADGCAVANPPLADLVRGAVAENGGSLVTASERAIEVAAERAWKDGFAIEPTSALAFAELERRIHTPATRLVIATGAAIKTFV